MEPVRVDVTGVPAIRWFFILRYPGGRELPFRDAEEKIVVPKSLALADIMLQRLDADTQKVGVGNGVIRIGMGEHKWRLFQSEMPHVEIDTEAEWLAIGEKMKAKVQALLLTTSRGLNGNGDNVN